MREPDIDWKTRAHASFRRANDLKTKLDDALYHLTYWRLKAEKVEIQNSVLRGRLRRAPSPRQHRSQIKVLTSRGMDYEVACEALAVLFPEEKGMENPDGP